MKSENITMHRVSEDKSEVFEQYPKTTTSQVYDFENERFLEELLREEMFKKSEFDNTLKASLTSRDTQTSLYNTMLDGVESSYSYISTMSDLANTKYDFVIPSNFIGTLELSLVASYNTGNASGSLTKVFNVCLSGGSVISQNTYYSDMSNTTREYFAISDVVYNSSTGVYVVTISQLKTGGRNTFALHAKTKSVGSYSGLLKTCTLSAPYVSTATVPKAESVLNKVKYGEGSPEGVVTATVGTIYCNLSGSTSTTLYVKTSGVGNTGWTAK